MATTVPRPMATACRLAPYTVARSSAVGRALLAFSHSAAMLVWRWLPAAATAALYDARSASTLGRSRIDVPGSTETLVRSISRVTVIAARAIPRNWGYRKNNGLFQQP